MDRSFELITLIKDQNHREANDKADTQIYPWLDKLEEFFAKEKWSGRKQDFKRQRISSATIRNKILISLRQIIKEHQNQDTSNIFSFSS